MNEGTAARIKRKGREREPGPSSLALRGEP